MKNTEWKMTYSSPFYYLKVKQKWWIFSFWVVILRSWDLSELETYVRDNLQ